MQGLVPPLRHCNDLHATSLPRMERGTRDACNIWGGEGVLTTESRRTATFAQAPRPNQLITFVREPSQHVISQYAHCQTPGGVGMHFHHYASISLVDWLKLDGSRARRHCGYDPTNMITRRLGDGSLVRAIGRVESAFFVGITAHYDASVCLVRSLLAQRRACTCTSTGTGTHLGPGVADDLRPTTERLNRPEQVDLTAEARDLISQRTHVDAFVYARALSRFYDGLLRFNLTCRLNYMS